MGKSKKKVTLTILLSLFSIIVLSILIFTLVAKSNLAKIDVLSSEDCLKYTLKDCDDGLITVGIIKDNSFTWTLYGKDGIVLPKSVIDYEIGSLTKTITASLISKAQLDSLLDVNDSIDKYLDLPKKEYPTILSLLTHTSGYNPYYFEIPMIKNFFNGENSGLSTFRVGN